MAHSGMRVVTPFAAIPFPFQIRILYVFHTRWLVAPALVSCSARRGRSAAGRDRQQLQVQLRSGHPADLRRLVAHARRRLHDAFRLSEPQLGAESCRFPVGPDNSIEPGGPDRGQPTFFYTRTQRNLFTVNVPKEWGKKELIWTADRQRQDAEGIRLAPARMGNRSGRRRGRRRRQHQPRAHGEQAADASRSDPVAQLSKLPCTATLTATVTDDGLPKPRGRRASRRSDRKRRRRFRAATRRHADQRARSSRRREPQARRRRRRRWQRPQGRR